MATGEAALTTEAGNLAPRELVHEFRNLLAVIVNYCELIADEIADADAIRADLHEIRTAAERALALTDKIPVPPKPGAPQDPTSDSS
jgi:signal transduction histidine kinase